MDDEQKDEELEADTDAAADEEEAEEAEDLSPSADPVPQTAAPIQHSLISWVPYFAVVSVVILLLDWILTMTGAALFWSEKTVYVCSYVLRFIVFIIASALYYKKIFSGPPKKIYMVNGWIGLTTGILLAAARFSHTQALWSFLNMLTEPIDGLIVALAASYLAYHYKNKLDKISV